MRLEHLDLPCKARAEPQKMAARVLWTMDQTVAAPEPLVEQAHMIQ